jgi:hypothetical protein
MSTQAMTLYSLSEDLTAHLESVDLTEPGSPQRDECEAAIRRYMEQLPAKVDSVARMLAHLENQAQMAAQEMQRLQNRKLEGETTTLALRPSEAAIVTDEAAVPALYKTAVLEMPAPVWEEFVRLDNTLVAKLTKQNLKVRLSDVKKAIKDGIRVPGADMEFRNNLVRK